jgi:hypothetical protein
VLVGAAVLTVLAVVVAANASRDEAAPGFSADHARYFNLPDGKAQIGVSTSGRSISVRWRDPDGASWTDPEVVYDPGRMIQTFMRIRVGGPTLALFATYTPRDTYYPEDDDVTEEEWARLDDDDVTAFVVCRDGSCTASRPYPGTLGDAPQVTPDGQHVFLAERDGAYVTWHGEDIVEQQPSGLPDGDYGDGQPLLAPDGSLRVVHGRPDPDGCDYTLLTTAPGEAAYAEAMRYQDARDRRERCTTQLETFSSDYVIVSRSKYDVWFLARTDDTWRKVAEDPSGQVRYPRPGTPKLAGAYERSGFWHWREVVATSPDGRTLVVQVHFPGEETWGPPRVVARAPEGSECIFIDPMPTYTHGEEDPFYINLRCRSRPSPGARRKYWYPTAVTDDGRTWHSFLATASGTRAGRDLIFRGHPTYRWSPEWGLRRVGPRVPPGAELTLLSDGTYALSSLVRSDDGCVVEVRLARRGDEGWGPPVPSTADAVPLPLCELEDVSGEGRNVYHYLGVTPAQRRMVRLVWRDDEPILEDGPSMP